MHTGTSQSPQRWGAAGSSAVYWLLIHGEGYPTTPNTSHQGSSTPFPLPRNIYVGTQSVGNLAPQVRRLFAIGTERAWGIDPRGYFHFKSVRLLGELVSRNLLAPHHPNLEGDPRTPVSRSLSFIQSVKGSTVP